MESEKPLHNQTALITGANSGIGEAIAKAMGAAGARVIVNYVTDEKQAFSVVEDIKQSGSEAIAVKADVSREADVQNMFLTGCRTYGSIDIVVSNAGIQADAPLIDMTMDQWHRVMGVNLTGAFLCAREAAREFVRRGVTQISEAAGKIIFISSVHERIPWAGHANYAASKGGIMMLMKTVAQELAPFKVRVNNICPGAIKTNINKKAWDTPEEENKLLQLIPYKRVGVPVDVGALAVWLASDESDYITGTSIYIDGGMLLYPGFRTGG